MFKLTVANAIRGVANTPASLTNQWVSLHTGLRGPIELSEISGGGYARKQVTWAAAVIDEELGEDGLIRSKLIGNPLTFDVPAGVTITRYGLWNVASGDGNGTSTGYLYGKELTAAILLNTAGKVTITPTHLYGLL